jgi:hypothetical protein
MLALKSSNGANLEEVVVKESTTIFLVGGDGRDVEYLKIFNQP